MFLAVAALALAEPTTYFREQFEDGKLANYPTDDAFS